MSKSFKVYTFKSSTFSFLGVLLLKKLFKKIQLDRFTGYVLDMGFVRLQHLIGSGYWVCSKITGEYYEFVKDFEVRISKRARNKGCCLWAYGCCLWILLQV